MHKLGHDAMVPLMSAQWVSVKTRLTPDEYRGLEHIAEQEERSIAQVLRRIVREKVAEKDKERSETS